jgi:glutathione S-transferase
MIELYRFPPLWGLPSPSPFCVKVETYLRMAELPYQAHNLSDPRKAPKGKLPFIRDDGKVIADSGVILDHLRASYGDKLDGDLSARDRATALGLRRMMEEHLYWYMVHVRWRLEPNWATVRQAFFSQLPLPLRLFLPRLVRKAVAKAMGAHGIGRHSEDELDRMALDDLTALSGYLGDKSYFMGDQPSELDAAAYAFLACILWPPFELPIRAELDRLDNLDAYCWRMKARYYPED